MSKRILIAVDESENSLKAVRFAAETFNKEVVITLLSILPDLPAACYLDEPSLMPVFKDNMEVFCAMEDAKNAQIEAFMDKAKHVLEDAGFAPENIAVRIRKQEAGIARDIVLEVENGHYDTLVIGRRGLTGIKQFILGSISNKIIHLAKDVAIVIVE